MTENKQTPVAEQNNTILVKLMNFWSANSKKISIALSVIILVAGGYFAYKTLVVAPKEKKATDAIWKAQEYYKIDSFRLALNGDGVNQGFLRIASIYGGTKAGDLAKFYAGSCYLQMGDFNNAVKYLKDFSTSQMELKVRAAGLLGDAYSEQGKKQEAIEQYKTAGTVYEEDESNSSEYLFRAGYLYETMGKSKEAIEMYKLIKEKYARSERGATIDKYLARLGEISE